MNSPRIFVIATLAVAAGVWPDFQDTATGREITIAEGSIAAIAYSPTTGKYGLAYDFRDRKSAEKDALSKCGEVILPSGKKIFPAAGTVLPSGAVILSKGEVLLPSGEMVRVGKDTPSRATSERKK